MKKLGIIFTVFAMFTNLIITASGANYEYVSTNLYADPIIFDVTVPTSIPIYVDAYGDVTVATDFGITNNSPSPVEINYVQLWSDNNWELTNYDTDFSSVSIDSALYALCFSDFDVVVDEDSNGVIGYLDLVNDWTLSSGEEKLLTYDAKISATTEDIEDLTIASITFVFDWVYGNVPIIYGVENGDYIVLSEDYMYYDLPEVYATSYNGDTEGITLEVSGYVEGEVEESHVVTFTAIDEANNTRKTVYYSVWTSSQYAQSMLGQANQAPQQILSLLG